MKKLFTALLLFSATIGSYAQVAPQWVKFSGPSNYQNYDVKQVGVGVDTLGNIYAGGSMIDTSAGLRNRTVLTKYSPAGVQQWVKYYDAIDPAYNGSYAAATLVDKGGNSYICGYGTHAANIGADFMCIKYDNAGNQLWVKYHDFPLAAADDYATCATFDAAGNIVVGGYAHHTNTSTDDAALVKWSPSGTELWTYVSSYGDEDRPLAITCDTASNIYYTGEQYSATTFRDVSTTKISASGNLLWNKVFSFAGDRDDDKGTGIVTDSAGNCYITGASQNWFTIKYSPAGNVLWTNNYTANQLNRFELKQVMLDPKGAVIVVGDAYISQTPQSDYIVTKLNPATGAQLWSINYNTAGIDRYESAAIDTGGYIYLNGKYEGPIGSDMSTIIVSPTSQVVWHTTYTNAAYSTGPDEAYQMVLDRNKNIILAGTSQVSTSQNAPVDIITLKYAAPNLRTGINDVTISEASFKLYPNPNQGILHLSVSDAGLVGAIISITSLQGEVVAETTLHSAIQSIDLSHAAKGIYLVTIKTTESSLSKKLIVE